MLEIDCVLNSLRHEFEVSETKSWDVCFFKAKKDLETMKTDLCTALNRFGLTPQFLAAKSDASGTAVRVQLTYDGSWG